MSKREPKGELSLRTLAMPADANPLGDIFGGWVLSQMDIAGGVYTFAIAKGRTVTVGIKEMTFIKPMFVGDILCIYVDLVNKGKTSITVHIEAWVRREAENERLLVTEGEFTFVAVDENRKPRKV